MDAISLLKKDHRTVEALFKQFEKLGENAGAKKKAIVQQLTKELSLHAAVEEQIFYPAARRALASKDEDMVLEAYEEHHLVKVTLSELDGMSPDSERYDAKVTVLKEMIEHHVEEEEEDLFPKVQKKLDKETLNAIGAAMEKGKKIAPTRAHPNAPDEPPGALIASLPAALLDRVRDLIQGSDGAGAKANGHRNGHAKKSGKASTMKKMKGAIAKQAKGVRGQVQRAVSR